MPKSIKVADDLIDIVREESALNSRSISGQLAHWVKIGRAIEQSSEFSYQSIQEVLNGARSPDALSLEEQEVWISEFAEKLDLAEANELEFFQERRDKGYGVGLNSDGTLVYEDKR